MVKTYEYLMAIFPPDILYPKGEKLWGVEKACSPVLV
jgi:hypothetical protein